MCFAPLPIYSKVFEAQTTPKLGHFAVHAFTYKELF